MKLRYLGTAAYEGIPSLFCQCELCKKARELGGRNLRSRSQALVNDDLLIDFPPDTSLHYMKYNFDWMKIENCLITHSHSDHLYVEDMEQARTDYSHDYQMRLHYYADRSGYRKMKKVFERWYMKPVSEVHLLTLGEIFKVGHYDVMAVRADHARSTSPVVYAISDGEKKMLYCHDSGFLSEKSLKQLQKFGKFDLLSLDCTGGLQKGWVRNHMCLETNALLVEKLKELGMADDHTICISNHFSHNGQSTYEELVEEASKHHFLISYDGMEVEF